MPTATRKRYPSESQFSTAQNTARTTHTGLGKLMTRSGFTQIPGTTGRNRKHWTR